MRRSITWIVVVLVAGVALAAAVRARAVDEARSTDWHDALVHPSVDSVHIGRDSADPCEYLSWPDSVRRAFEAKRDPMALLGACSYSLPHASTAGHPQAAPQR